ncbi:MAG: transposase domain-containing protein, partial [Chloroflexi bacterium]|nr:transposase domain-containing protein [Chloroflexota bacterium]
MLGDRLVGYTLREIAAERKFSQELRIEVLEQVLPVATIQAVLAREGRMGQRERKLNMVLTVLLLIVQHIYSNLSQREAM